MIAMQKAQQMSPSSTCALAPEQVKRLAYRSFWATIALGALAVGITPPLAIAQDAAAKATPNTVVAKVNGAKITEKDISFAEIEIGSDLGNIPPESRRRVLVEYLIENQLFADAAQKQKLAETSSFDERLEYMRRRALREEFFETQIKPSVSEAAAKTYFNDQIKGMKQEEEVKARHILVETEDEARDILEKVNRGEDFEKLAKENSKDPGSKVNGGLLGYFGRGQMVPQFEDAAFKSDVGDVSQPVQSRFGWHIIKVEDKRKKPLPTFDAVKDRILNSMILQQAQAKAQDLRSASKIEYLDPEIKKQIVEQEKAAASQKNAILEQIKKLQSQENKGEAAKPAEPK
ncbi:MAG: peptidylprolyl isomerase [Pseudomonadota bacterium]